MYRFISLNNMIDEHSIYIYLIHPSRYGDETHRRCGVSGGSSADTTGSLPEPYEGGRLDGPNDWVLHPQPQVIFLIYLEMRRSPSPTIHNPPLTHTIL